jgi:hypothetical protein
MLQPTKTDLQLLQARVETLMARQAVSMGGIAVAAGILYSLLQPT